MKIYRENKIMGVLGGMGPEATVKFYELLIKISQEKYRAFANDSFPEIIIYSVPVPDFISSLKSKETAKKMLISRIKLLSEIPISFFCVSCNTAHLLLDNLMEAAKVPFISIIEETAEQIRRLGIKKVGLLASPTTLKTKIYQKQLKYLGITVVLPEEKEIAKLGFIIKRIVSGKRSKKDTIALEEIAKGLLSRKAEAIILGCTELPLLLLKKFRVPVLNTLEILAEACLGKYCGRIRGSEKV